MDLQVIQSKIYNIRGYKIMLDFDLAELYQVEIQILKKSRQKKYRTIPGGLYAYSYRKRVRQLEVPNWYLKLGRFSIQAICFHARRYSHAKRNFKKRDRDTGKYCNHESFRRYAADDRGVRRTT